MKLPPLIGLSGKAGSGKSTVAEYLRTEHDYYPLAFAGVLKEVVGRAFGFSQKQLSGGLKEVIDPRCGKSPRWCLQHFGSAFREIYPEIWLWHIKEIIQSWQGNGGIYLSHPRDCQETFKSERLVVTDVRLRNEAETLKELGGVLWRLERPGHEGAVNGIPDHISETELDNFDGWDVVIEAPTKAQLFSQVDKILNKPKPFARDLDRAPFYPDVPIREDF